MKVSGSAASLYSGEQGLSQGILRGRHVDDECTTVNFFRLPTILTLIPKETSQ
jgi:hypothetical protein